jgi:pimeloyl-ACP methyl ester carboxylesterase
MPPGDTVTPMAYAQNTLDATRVYFEDDGGPGAPTVILGGFLDPIELVRRWPVATALRGLPEEFRLVFIDHRGHGRTDKPHDDRAYAMHLRVADVVAVLDELGIERAHIIGLSWGGRLAFGVGEHARERVLSIVAVGQQPYAIDPDGPLTRVVGDALGASRHRGIAALVEAFEGLAGRYPEPVRRRYLAQDAAAMRAAWNAALTEGPVSPDLGGWRVPCLICVAADDADFFEQARRAAAEIPDAEFVSVDRTDHLGMDTASVDPVWSALLRTVRRADHP